MAGKCEREVWEDSTIGSDHYPIFSNIHIDREVKVEGREVTWIFSKARWDQFHYLCKEGNGEIDQSQEIEKVEEKFRGIV